MLKPLDPFHVKLPDFEGPLDLLLYLIEREELDITRVSLAKVTGSYLEYIHLLEQLQVDQVADFLVVAAKLLLIKSEALLPRPPAIKSDEEEDVGDDLVKQLLLYKQYKESARKLFDRETAGLHTYVRVAPPPKIEAKLDLSNVTVDMLIKAVRGVLEIEPPHPPVGTVVKPFTLTIREQMNLIERILRYRPNIELQAHAAPRAQPRGDHRHVSGCAGIAAPPQSGRGAGIDIRRHSDYAASARTATRRRVHGRRVAGRRRGIGV